jgi:hypothetical protein
MKTVPCISDRLLVARSFQLKCPGDKRGNDLAVRHAHPKKQVIPSVFKTTTATAPNLSVNERIGHRLPSDVKSLASQ